MLCCAGRGMLTKKACRALPLLHLVLVTAVNASIPRTLANHCTGHERNKQASKQAKERLVVHTQKSYKIQIFT